MSASCARSSISSKIKRLTCGGQGRVLCQHPEYETSVCDKGYARNADECQYPLERARHEIGVDLTRSFVGFPHLGEECRTIAQGFDIRGRLYLGQRLLGRFSRLELECQGSAGEIFRHVPKYYWQYKCNRSGKVQKSQLSQELCHSLPLFALHQSLAGMTCIISLPEAAWRLSDRA